MEPGGYCLRGTRLVNLHNGWEGPVLLFMKCIHTKTGRVVAEHVELAATFWKRLKGLMLRKCLPAGNALLLDPCPQIHTCFMRFEIDVVFLDVNNRVIAVLESVRPWRMSKFYTSSRRTLELPGGTLQHSICAGDELIFN